MCLWQSWCFDFAVTVHCPKAVFEPLSTWASMSTLIKLLTGTKVHYASEVSATESNIMMDVHDWLANMQNCHFANLALRVQLLVTSARVRDFSRLTKSALGLL